MGWWHTEGRECESKWERVDTRCLEVYRYATGCTIGILLLLKHHCQCGNIIAVIDTALQLYQN